LDCCSFHHYFYPSWNPWQTIQHRLPLHHLVHLSPSFSCVSRMRFRWCSKFNQAWKLKKWFDWLWLIARDLCSIFLPISDSPPIFHSFVHCLILWALRYLYKDFLIDLSVLHKISYHHLSSLVLLWILHHFIWKLVSELKLEWSRELYVYM